MENKTVKPLWDRNADYPQLRRPNACTNIENESVPNDSSVLDVAKTSNLSVEAAEWYPPGYNNPQSHNNISQNHSGPVPKHSVQCRLQKFRPQPPEPAMDDRKEIEFLRDIINTLSNKPGEFDDCVFDLLYAFEPYFQSIETMSKVTTAIFHQCLAVANFQYSGVRLFAVLDERSPFVRGVLHSLCEKELEKNANVQNILLFYADIYAKLNFELFGKCLLKILKKLKPGPDNVKIICQTLKLTGYTLERLDEPFVSDLIRQLNSLRGVITPNMTFLVESVIKLKDNNWGQTERQPVAAAPPAEPEFDYADGPIFYGPDGMALTSEESDFLAENLNDFIIDDSDPDGLWNPEPEMSEEIQAAFAEFISSNNR